ncbi:pentatricopeptide repeat-containing protein At1g08070, chloroplastic-like [Impatiens glandulifera]|uniref:pentatricopeptide repeat-containing protein At1g08070, chloroplastic-like n=1 Tax=Impatiens glandulifera TaxID=253017 RepID=UPI001FB0F7DF|nr:pentatricopeptide repeat-containing protein At1g08070, chloroplastic-like [Impatiens glandulifera]
MRAGIYESLLVLIESCKTLQQFKQFHAKSTILGHSYTNIILKKLSPTLLSNESLDYASRLLSTTPEADIFIWNVIIKAYSVSPNPVMAIHTYNRMREKEKVMLDRYTCTFVLKACANLIAIDKGKEIHAVGVRQGLVFDRFSQNSLLNFYMVCGEFENARKVFDDFQGKDVVFWNSMINGYAKVGLIHEVLQVWREMMMTIIIKPSEGTIVGIITACIESKKFELGREIHGYVIKESTLSKQVKIGASLIDLYMKSGHLEYARRLFDEMPEKNTVVWNSLINGYCRAGCLSHAIDLFREMINSMAKPDQFSISLLLSGCAQDGAFNLGKWVRDYAISNGIWDKFIATSLLDMYAKCGFVQMAREVFDQMSYSERTLATWNSIIAGYASHGFAEPALDLFIKMEESGMKPDSITFLTILHACAHSGLIDKGKQYFESMKYKGVKLGVEHYGCMVDLLGRAGLVKEAKELIERMEMKPNVIVLGALLSASRIHGDIETGEWAAERIFEMDRMDGGTYVLLGNLYGANKRFAGSKESIRMMMMERGVKKPLGCSLIEIGDCVHQFGASDMLHFRCNEIYSVLNDLSKKLKLEETCMVSLID